MQGGEGKDEKLPPGFRFHPTDEELITYYLINKISDASFTGRAVADVDLNKCEPWDLPGKAKMGEKEWYFFSLRDRKYPTGVRTNRATNTGYWKTTGKDKEIFNSVTTELVGMKKTLVFYRGRAPRGEKTNWVMHEYRIHSKSVYRTSKQDEWVVCRVFQKSAGGKKYPSTSSSNAGGHARGGAPVNVNNPYNINLEIGGHPSAMQQMHMHSQMMQQAAVDAGQFPISGRNHYMMTNPEMAEISRVLRAGGGGGGGGGYPIQPQLNYPGGGAGAAAGGGGCFTISGLNLNLGGGGGRGGGASTAQMPIFRPPQPPGVVNLNLQDTAASSSMFTAGTSAIPTDQSALYGADQVNNTNANHMTAGNRYITNMDHLDLENYWPQY